ncbi:MAG: 4-phosphopantetheinyl transferase family protein [Flavobacterium sp.]|uniref:4'-phosphopantetheinyl transferase family protein n=1 Tax=Flavobacterium sp. TaxID=239 RepID=UPI0011FA7E4B|nr:4'-phosphopantetheinyl transferase superfamily protein [Flavobacterium sp.]RZJ67346.1 MAG: 4-phosphopantetheinyl transferase family protein [Flavobacterium sp.]
MIGNDVIDLELAAVQSDWRRKGFLEKLFSKSEIHLIKTSQNADVSVWDLWSRKEAAYKIFNRQTGIRAFNPQHFVCENLESESTVRYENAAIFSRTEIQNDSIHTIAVSDKCYFSRILSVEKTAIQKIDGLPFFMSGEKKIPATVSNHGRFEFCLALIGDRLNFDFPG